ncbi:MAG: hypothetical protein KDB88_01005 [Flavobacteriales bacterium]|nr:hypothetical protein [Flavobacteriales bacterium]
MPLALRIVPVILTYCLSVATVIAGGPVSWSFAAVADAEGRSVIELSAMVEEGWHIYALELPRDDGPLPTVVRIQPSGSFELLEVNEPEPEEVMDPNFQMVVRYHSGSPVLRAVLMRKEGAAITVLGEVEFMACNDMTCLPPVSVPFEVELPALKK